MNANLGINYIMCVIIYHILELIEKHSLKMIKIMKIMQMEINKMKILIKKIGVIQIKFLVMMEMISHKKPKILLLLMFHLTLSLTILKQLHQLINQMMK